MCIAAARRAAVQYYLEHARIEGDAEMSIKGTHSGVHCSAGGQDLAVLPHDHKGGFHLHRKDCGGVRRWSQKGQYLSRLMD